MTLGNSDRDNNIFIYDRCRAELSGINDVYEFSDARVYLGCSDNVTISIEGSSLKICSFDSSSGNLEISGHIDSVVYFGEEEKKQRRKLFS